MTFTHRPLTDAEAADERRALLRASEARPKRLGSFRQATIAGALALVFGAAFALAAVVDALKGTDELLAVAMLCVVLTVLFAGWCASTRLHDSSASHAAEAIKAAYVEASAHELEYLLAMKAQYIEIGAALREWVAADLTIRARDVWAVRAWVNRVEPGLRRSGLLGQLSS